MRTKKFLAVGWRIFFVCRVARPHISTEKFRISKSARWFLCWIGVLGLASAVGIHPLDSFIGGSYRHQGVLFFFTLFLVSETLRLIGNSQRKLLYSIVGIGVVVESIFVLLEKGLHWTDRPLGTFGEPNAVAGFLAIGLYWVATRKNVSRWVHVLALCIIAAAIAATGSRTGIAASLIIFIGLGIQSLQDHYHRALQGGFILGALVFLCIGSVVMVRVITMSRAPSMYENRGLYWTVGFEEFMKRPVFGYGAESEEVLYDRAFAAKNIRLVDFMIDRSHNVFVDVALWSGIVGLVVFMRWLLLIVFDCLARRDHMRVIAILAWILFASFQPLGTVAWIQLSSF